MGTVNQCCTNESKIKLEKTRRENMILKQQLLQTHRSCRHLAKKIPIKHNKKSNKLYNRKTKTKHKISRKQKEFEQNAPEPKPMHRLQRKEVDYMELAILGYIRPFIIDIPMDIACIIVVFYDCCTLFSTQDISPLDDMVMLHNWLTYPSLNEKNLKTHISKYLATRTSPHRRQTVDVYYERYGTDLMDDISRIIKNGRFLELIDGLFRRRTYTEFCAHCINDIVTNKTNVNVVVDVTDNPDPTDQDISVLMDLNLFGQGPIINKPAIQSPNAMNIECETDPIKEIEELLVEMDEDENGYIDFSEFEEAIKMIDKTIIHGEIDAMYDLMSGSNIPSFPGMDNILQTQQENKSVNDNEEELDGNDLEELNIKIYTGYIGYKYNEHQENKEKKETKSSEKSRRSSLQIVLSESNVFNIPSESSVNTKMIIRIAFPDIFENNTRDSLQNLMDVTAANLWGVKSLSSLDRLMEELQEEAPDCKTLDYAEFEAAMNNLGVQFEQNNLEILFAHFIEAQSVSITSKHLHKRKELNIQFFTKYIGKKVRNHKVMDPKQILETAFGQLLLNGIKRQKESHKDILNVNNNLAVNDNVNDDHLNGLNVNPYYDDDLMNDVSKHFAPDKIRTFEKNHSVKEGISPRKLLRMGSSLKWKGDELDDLESQMNAQFELLVDQHTTSQSQGNKRNNLINNSAQNVLKPIE